MMGMVVVMMMVVVLMVVMTMKNLVMVVMMIVVIIVVMMMIAETTLATMVMAVTATVTVPSCGPTSCGGSHCLPTCRLSLLHYQRLLCRTQTLHRADLQRRLRHSASISATCHRK